MAGSCASSRFFETAVFLILGYTNIKNSFARMVAVLSWYVCNVVACCVVNVYNGGLSPDTTITFYTASKFLNCVHMMEERMSVTIAAVVEDTPHY